MRESRRDDARSRNANRGQEVKNIRLPPRNEKMHADSIRKRRNGETKTVAERMKKQSDESEHLLGPPNQPNQATRTEEDRQRPSRGYSVLATFRVPRIGRKREKQKRRKRRNVHERRQSSNLRLITNLTCNNYYCK